MIDLAITVAAQEWSRRDILDLLDPLVAEWFSTFPTVTPSQKYAVANIQQGRSVLIASPTGSGKTLSAFISIISQLVALARQQKLEETVYCVYVSPLRSLNNDVQKNLLIPLEAIQGASEERGLELPQIRIGVRTGDTPSNERQKMLKHPPHILITTPESLAIMLCAPKFREKLRKVRWIIIDEIHEICSSKRGVHLTLSLERLQDLCEAPFSRIGLSATIHPTLDVARFLVGYEDGFERDCVIADSRFVKATKLEVTCPVSDIIHSSSAMVSSRMYRLIRDMVLKSRTTLIFTNTRSGTERVVYHLAKLNAVDGDELAAHHSSLSRETRKDVEDRLKEGRMRAVVTSTSLELGIDIGSIDRVVQIGSPKSISRCLQRVGRAGHALDRVSKGLLVPLERDDLVEDAVIASEACVGRLDRIYIPKMALDVLAQHVVGMAIEHKWTVGEALSVIRRSYCYRNLSVELFRRVLKYLSGGYQNLEGFRVYGKIWYDESTDTFGRRGALLRVIYSTNIGTIPDQVAVKVYTTKKRWVGSIEEEFLERLSRGDIFVLGGRTYQFRYARAFRAYVVPVDEGKPTVPTWFSEMLPLSFDLGEVIGKFRARISTLLRGKVPLKNVVRTVQAETHCDEYAARAIVGYMKAEQDFLQTLGVDKFPDNKAILVEEFVDEEGRENIIFNCVFGRRVHDALSRAYANMVMKMKRGNVMVTVSDSGFMLTLPQGMKFDPALLVKKVSSSNLREILLDAIANTEMVRRRFRHCATRALMVLRNYKGHEITVSRQQTNAQILMSVCEGLDRFPVLEETYREVVEDLMDVKTGEDVLRDVEDGHRSFVLCPRSDLPSPFTHDLILLGYSDVVLMADKKALLKALHDSVLKRIQERKEGKRR